MSRRPEWIMVHHSATKDSGTVSWAAIERFHRETQGWRDIGYHAGLELVGGPELGPYAYQALIGRSVNSPAAACKEGEMNTRALHVCVVGNFDDVAPSSAILAVLKKRVLLPWMDLFGIPADHIVGHRDYATYKTCPGRSFDLEAVRRMVR